MASPSGSVSSSKQNWAGGSGFDTMGWGPEGQVFFQYAVNTAGNGYTISAIADLDNDNTNQGWFYMKRDGSTDVAAVHTTECTTSGKIPTQVGPCASSHGQTVF